jgi:hypothetical protein
LKKDGNSPLKIEKKGRCAPMESLMWAYAYINGFIGAFRTHRYPVCWSSQTNCGVNNTNDVKKRLSW